MATQMNETHNAKLKRLSQILRKNMTPEEKHLWYDFLKKLPLTVHRQMVIGSYIVDFCIPEKRIVIELDGMQHGDESHMQADAQRDQALQKAGYSVLRYANQRAKREFSAVCQDIWQHVFPTTAEP